MKKLFIPIVLTGIFIVFVGILTQTLDGEETFLTRFVNPSATPKVSESEFANIKVGTKTVRARKADTDPERQKGLSGTKSLAENDGVLFTFGTSDTPAQNIKPKFWMKDMLIAIDIVWIDDGKIVDIDHNVQPPAAGTPDNQLIIYESDKPVDYVLEVNGSWVEKNAIKIGDEVDIP